ncbi:glycosyltransferase [Phocaeicola plebeius]|uniref:glycosyltransferase n=1 Tax=Phocaeicola plebeius TaxID=310297 RepID=UPI002942EC8A|nr:glycosyltransferase [Phocaeicola plebeius]
MKIIHFVPSIDRTSGGVGSYMQLLAKELGKLCELYIVTANTEHQLKIENAEIRYIPCNISQYGSMKKEWNRILDEIKPDLVHVNCCWMPCCALVQKWSQRKGHKVILTPHGMLEPWIMKRNYWTKKIPALLLYQKAAIKKADCIHATAESEKQNILKLGYNKKIEVIANGIDVENIKIKDNWRRNKNILFLSRIHVKKGIEFLLEAVSSLKSQLEGYTITIAGEGDQTYISSLKSKALELGIDRMVNFCGGVYGEKKWEFYRKADVFVLPTYSENFGIVIAEALASGTPVITTKGTPWNDLNTMQCGWCINIGLQPLISALNDFLGLSDKTIQEYALRGRLLVENKFDIKKIAKDFICLYKTQIAK